ncbi:MAG: LacI family DNA-binding transcriptional regulator [Lachnospiraceae bacterium]|nr:LacI family DNA-binding transcriptional regulator [Lachnospiraceae bacterium]
MLKAVTMSDIAEKLNISTVTVSKALANQKGVSEEMREKIKSLADDMGYKYTTKDKDFGKSYNMGVLVSKRYLDSSDSFYGKMCQEITAKAMEKGSFTLLEFIQEEEERKGKLPKLIRENKIDGLIVVGKPGFDYAKMLEKTVKKPMVFLDFYDADLRTDSVIANSYLGAYMLTKYLIKAGHREIAYVGTLLVTDSITDRYLGYVRAMMEHNLPVEPQWLINDRDFETGLMELYREIKLPEKMPTAFVCNCDYIASILIKTLKERGYRVPEDVSVVGFDNYLYPWLCDIGITTYEVNIPEMSRKAVETLYNRLEGIEDGLKVSTVPGRLVEKDSVKKIKKIG